jgi:hypothetical protein
MPHEVIDRVHQLAHQKSGISREELDVNSINQTDMSYPKPFNDTLAAEEVEEFHHISSNDDINQMT